jgi:hypothetical protein
VAPTWHARCLTAAAMGAWKQLPLRDVRWAAVAALKLAACASTLVAGCGLDWTVPPIDSSGSGSGAGAPPGTGGGATVSSAASGAADPSGEASASSASGTGGAGGAVGSSAAVGSGGAGGAADACPWPAPITSCDGYPAPAQCEDCVYQDGACAGEVDVCNLTAGCPAVFSCTFACDDYDPTPECYTDCFEFYSPEAVDAFLAERQCMACKECPSNQVAFDFELYCCAPFLTP